MKITMNQYISRRLGGTRGELPRLMYMLRRSFTASNFRLFWTYWNPIYGYILGFYVYKPLTKLSPPIVARTLTFTINGIFHDILVSIIIGRPFYSVTILFIIYGIALIIEEKLKIEMNTIGSKVVYNLMMLMIPFILIMIVI